MSSKGFIEFLRKAPTQFHVVKQCTQQLKEMGFTRLSEKEVWEGKIQPCGRYYFTRNESSLFAFCVGKEYKQGNGFAIVAAHTDSPSLKLKPISKQETKGHLLLGVEMYGGGKFYTWADRDLSLAGRVVFEQEGHIETKIFDLHKALCFIPSLAIHLSDEKERKGDRIEFNKETQLLPILGLGSLDEKESEVAIYNRHPKELVDLICQETGVSADSILDMDCYLYDPTPATIGGIHDEFVFSGKIDNLSMTYCGLQGFLQSLQEPIDDDPMVRVLALFDHEEIGSASLAGAESTSLRTIITQLSGESMVSQAIRKSFLLSYDVSHAFNPEYSDKTESNHRCILNKGVVMSFAASQNMATSAPSAAVMRYLCKKNHLDLQSSVKKQDMREGSTVGPRISTQLGILTADCGIPQLAMHSIREMCGTKDIETGVKIAEAFYREWGTIEKNMKLGEEFWIVCFQIFAIPFLGEIL